MRGSSRRSNWSVLLLALAAGVVAEPILLVDPTTAPETLPLILADSQASAARDGDRPVWRLEFASGVRWPGVGFPAEGCLAVSDWRDQTTLAMTLTNPGTTPVNIGLRVNDADTATSQQWRQGTLELAPGATVSVKLPLISYTIDGMHTRLRARGLIQDGDGWMRTFWLPDIDLGRITEVRLFVPSPPEPVTLLFGGLTLERGRLNLDPFVDRYGQFTDDDWPEKIHTDADLAAALAAEDADLAANPPPADRDPYGGWLGGPTLEATGRFRVTRHEGKWWFVTPDGHLYFASGITGIHDRQPTFVEGRERWFTWLPGPDDPLAGVRRRVGQREAMDFYQANLLRKYGTGYQDRYYDRSLDRLQSWGFTCIGNWSDPAAWQRRRLPYTIPVHVPAPGLEVRAGSGRVHRFPDVFHPDWEARLGEALVKLEPYRDDPWLLGVFIDNELQWSGWQPHETYRYASLLLAADRTQATKVAATDLLRTRYESIAQVNQAWGVQLADWADLLDGVELTREQAAQAQPDLAAVTALVAERYYSTCRRLMEQHLPGCLYLGSRLNLFNREVLEAAARHCHVVSHNMYRETPSSSPLQEGDLATELNYPILIGEYHFNALDSGMWGRRPVAVTTQAERAAGLTAYLTDAAQAPWCVGAHWFQYHDQAITGRFDGENFNIGFVTIADTPYAQLRAAARQVHRQLYPLRAATR